MQLEDPKSFRLTRPEQNNRGPRSSATMLRWATRAFMLIAIAALAIYRGYSAQAIGSLVLIVVWALALPFVLRALARRLEVSGMERGPRRMVLLLLGLALLAAFAFGARALLPG